MTRTPKLLKRGITSIQRRMILATVAKSTIRAHTQAAVQSGYAAARNTPPMRKGRSLHDGTRIKMGPLTPAGASKARRLVARKRLRPRWRLA